MFITLETDGRLQLPPSVVETLSLREGALLDCKVNQGIVFLTPAKSCNTDDFPPERGFFRIMLWFIYPVLERKARSHSRQKGLGNAGVFVR